MVIFQYEGCVYNLIANADLRPWNIKYSSVSIYVYTHVHASTQYAIVEY